MYFGIIIVVIVVLAGGGQFLFVSVPLLFSLFEPLLEAVQWCCGLHHTLNFCNDH